MDRDNPFVIALEHWSFRTLRRLVELYPEDRAVGVAEMQRMMQDEHGQVTARRSREEEMAVREGPWTETVQEYLWRHDLSLMDAACQAAYREFVEWLLAQEPLLGSLRDRDCLGQTALMSAAMGLGSSNREGKWEDAIELIVDEERSWEESEERRRQHHEAFIRWLMVQEGCCSVEESDLVSPTIDGTGTNTCAVLAAAIPRASYELVCSSFKQAATRRLAITGGDPSGRRGMTWGM